MGNVNGGRVESMCRLTHVIPSMSIKDHTVVGISDKIERRRMPMSGPHHGRVANDNRGAALPISLTPSHSLPLHYTLSLLPWKHRAPPCHSAAPPSPRARTAAPLSSPSSQQLRRLLLYLLDIVAGPGVLW